MYLYSASAIMMAALIVVCAGVPDPSAEQADIFRAAGLPLPKFLHGVREPDATFQKSREEVFNDDATPFSDWYYVYVRDVKTRERWAFTYAMSRCSKSMPQAPPCSYSGAWPSVVVMRPGHPALSYAERHPLSAWSASAVSQDAKIVGGNSSYSIRATTPDGDHIRLVGDMASPSLAWPVAKGAQLAKGGISWDLTVSRRAGWFGESWIEGMDLGRLTGAIMWSPYAHQSTVEGRITIGGETVDLGGDLGRFRAYADSNWGSTMPRPPPQSTDARAYPWGWYYATQPHADPALDASIICGAGRTFMKYAGTVYGKLCDMRIGDKLRLSLWSWTFERLGNRTASWASDGGAQAVERFSIGRSAWSGWSDEFGNATVPMAQRLEIVTRSHNVTLSFAASQEETSRLTFARSFKVLGLGETVDLPRTQILPSLPSLPSLRHPLAISRILSSCKYSILLIYLSVLYVLIKHVSGK